MSQLRREGVQVEEAASDDAGAGVEVEGEAATETRPVKQRW